MTPKAKGFYFPPEWYPHEATWLSFPKNMETWDNRFEQIYPAYFEFIALLAKNEKVRINAGNPILIEKIKTELKKREISEANIELFDHPTNDSWCRDHGPAFLIDKVGKEKMIVNWGYNAWGGKYPPFNDDDAIPEKIAQFYSYNMASPGIIMEGGSVEFNGAGTILSSKSCLLNKNRNPHLNQAQIENYLCQYYGMDQILWVSEGVAGDDTDGHIDDTIRFVNEDTVLAVVETNKSDENYTALKKNRNELSKMRILSGKQLNVIELPMPDPVYDSGLRLPASYANFYIANEKVIVPTYRCKKDETAMDIISQCFPNRKIYGIDSTELIWGLGSFHCLSQQEPALMMINNC